jgi:hypothetical protein
MSDKKIIIGSKSLVILVPEAKVGPAGPTGNPIAVLSALPEYTNDDAARAAGKTTGDWYIIAQGSDIGPHGLLKKVVPILT